MTSQQWTEAVRAMGDESKIRTTLVAEGHKGRLLDPCDCPMARKLRSMGAVSARVDDDEITIRDAETGLIFTMELTEGVSRFVCNFDHRLYPELIK